ncbi:discoidin domain-containing protein [Paenibacillus athensensis]|nr:discoidin domain-containing protein [Paenibacillus athensensis]
MALNKSIAESGHTQVYGASNANDGNQATYWEGPANSYPNTLTVDLGSSYSVSKVTLQLPVGWGSRTQTLSVQGSVNGSTYSTLVSSATYTFNPSANTVTITFPSASARYVRLNFTANSGATAGQISEFQIYQ